MADNLEDYGFDKNLNRTPNQIQSNIVYDTFESTESQNVNLGSFGAGADTSNIRLDPTKGQWMGAERFEDAPFSVDMEGNATLASANVSGTITASSGSIGGFDVGSDYIRDSANSMGLSSTVTGADDVRFFAGGSFANRNSAPFRVTEGGSMTVGDSRNYMKWNGSFVEIQGLVKFGDGSFFGNFNDGLTQTVAGTGSITRNWLDTSLQTGATSSSSAKLSTPISSNTGGLTYVNFDASIRFSAVYAPVGLFNGEGSVGFLGIYDSATLASLSTTVVTARHMGFFLYGKSGSFLTFLAASNADGTTQAITSIDQPAVSPTSLRIEKDSATSIKFYANDTLIATHTTGIPTANRFNLQFGVANNSISANRHIYISNNYQVVTND